MANKTKPLGIGIQCGLLKNMFPTSTVANLQDKCLIWKYKLRPSPLSDEYQVKLEYHIGKQPQLFIIDPDPLLLAKNASRLPHVYDQKKQRLYLFYPDDKQWNSSMLLARTIVLWAYEWLYHYELWLGTNDDWKGGGVHPYNNQQKVDDLTLNIKTK